MLITDVTGNDSWQRALVLINPQRAGQQFTIPAGNWQVFVDHRQAGSRPIIDKIINGQQVEVAGRGLLVLGERKQ